ncbi:MAG: hypothetical protein J3R72DRAFT_447336 [Linnemannia gamsii]|nr:MAG: hypothetical protein J3R72DRAFT_447336 [Linnemannia gamsii]
MQFKQIIVLASLTLLVANTLAASQANTFQIDGKKFQINMFGVVVDLDTECDGQPCNYPERKLLFTGFSNNDLSLEAIFDDSPPWDDFDNFCYRGGEPIDPSRVSCVVS